MTGTLLTSAVHHPEDRRELVIGLLNDVTTAFSGAINELLATMERLDASLGWLKPSAAGTARSGTGMCPTLSNAMFGEVMRVYPVN